MRFIEGVQTRVTDREERQYSETTAVSTYAGRPLSGKEVDAYASALGLLTAYFNREIHDEDGSLRRSKKRRAAWLFSIYVPTVPGLYLCILQKDMMPRLLVISSSGQMALVGEQLDAEQSAGSPAISVGPAMWCKLPWSNTVARMVDTLTNTVATEKTQEAK
jgi:hypothetical protein